MAKRTFLELCNKVRQECKIPGVMTSTAGQTGIFLDVVTWTADADNLIQTKWFDWNFLWSQWSTPTIVSTANYVAPTDLNQWDKESIFLDYSTATFTQLKELKHKTWRKGVRNGVLVDNRPAYFVRMPNKSLTLSPVPDGVYSLSADYFKQPVRMSDNADTSDIPEQFEQAIIELAKFRYAEDQGSQVLLNNANEEFAFWLSQLEKAELPDNEDRGMVNHEELVVRPE